MTLLELARLSNLASTEPSPWVNLSLLGWSKHFAALRTALKYLYFFKCLVLILLIVMYYRVRLPNLRILQGKVQSQVDVHDLLNVFQELWGLLENRLVCCDTWERCKISTFKHDFTGSGFKVVYGWQFWFAYWCWYQHICRFWAIVANFSNIEGWTISVAPVKGVDAHECD